MLKPPKRDCFAFKADVEDGCNCLKRLYCRNGNSCPFYKTREQLNNQEGRETGYRTVRQDARAIEV